MTTFTLDTDNNITAHDAPPAAQDNVVAFATEKELTKLSADWPITRFVEVWNAFAGAPPFGDLKPVKKFTDRKTAVARIWKAIQTLGEELLRASIRDTEAKLKAARTAPAPAQDAAPVAPKKAKAAKQAATKDAAPTTRDGSKKAIVLTCSSAPTAPHSPTSCPRPRGRPIMPTFGLCRPVLATRPVGRESLRWSRHNP